MTTPRPQPNVSLRLAPFAKVDLDAVVQAVVDEGQGCKQADVVAVLSARARSLIKTKTELDALADEVRAYRKRAKPLGY